MLVDGEHRRTIWLSEKPGEEGCAVIIDQRHLPFKVVFETLRNNQEFCKAISEMHVRGAGCIGVTAAYGMYCGAVRAQELVNNSGALGAEAVVEFFEFINEWGYHLLKTRPTAANLRWAVTRQLRAIRGDESQPITSTVAELVEIVKKTAIEIADEDVEWCKAIGQHGLGLIRELSRKSIAGMSFNILTHCNAGWLAFVDYGTATGPVYAAQEAGMNVHVWVDETRPRNQGAFLTAWELKQQGVSHTVIPDNTGGHLMQNQMVDMVIVGADRVTITGDVANKIGTYLKALAAKDNNIPFYVAFGSSAVDWKCRDGLTGIPIEIRSKEEVTHICGPSTTDGQIHKVRVVSEGSDTTNFAFDVTPARLITGFITERGICSASEEGLLSLFPEKRRS